MSEPEPPDEPDVDLPETKPVTRTKAKLTRELNILSAQVTDRCRFMAVAIIGACWVMRSSPSVFAPWLLSISIVLAILAVTADFLQYVGPYRHFAARYRAMKEAGEDSIPLNETAFLYRSRWLFFHVKIWLTAASALLFCVAAALELSHHRV